MPGRRKKDVPEEKPGSDPVEVETSEAVPHPLTRELLDWAIHALTAVLDTDLDHPVKYSVAHTLKRLDWLYPTVLEGEERVRNGMDGHPKQDPPDPKG